MHHSEYLFSALQAAAVTLNLPHAQISIDGHDIDIYGVTGWEEASLYREAVLSLSKSREKLGQAQLQALWHIYQNEFVVYMSDGGMEYNPKDFAQWVRNAFKGRENLEYIVTCSYTVARIFQDVHKAHMSGSPFQDSQGDITVDRLMETDGLISRFNTISTVWEKASDENKGKLIEATMDAETRDDVKEVADSLRGVKTAVDWVKPDFYIYTRGDKTDLVFKDLDPKQAAFIQGLVAGSASPVYAEQEAVKTW